MIIFKVTSRQVTSLPQMSLADADKFLYYSRKWFTAPRGTVSMDFQNGIQGLVFHTYPRHENTLCIQMGITDEALKIHTATCMASWKYINYI